MMNSIVLENQNNHIITITTIIIMTIIILLPAPITSVPTRQALVHRVRSLTWQSQVHGWVLQDPVAAVEYVHFHLVYHGAQDDRILQEAIAHMYMTMVPGLVWVAPHCQQPHQSIVPLDKPAGIKVKGGVIKK